MNGLTKVFFVVFFPGQFMQLGTFQINSENMQKQKLPVSLWSSTHTHTRILETLKGILYCLPVRLCVCIVCQFDNALVKLSPADSGPLSPSSTLQKSIIQLSLPNPTASYLWMCVCVCSLFSNNLFSCSLPTR